MKVAFILSRCSYLGPFIVARDIAYHLYNTVEKLDIYYLRESDNSLDFAVTPQKLNFFEKKDWADYDIVHSHGFVADAYVSYHRKRFSGKQLTTMHQRIAPDYAMKYNRLFGLLFEKLWCRFIKDNHAIVMLTNELCRHYHKKLPAAKLSFIYNGITVPEQQEDILKEDLQQIEELKRTHTLIGISARLIYLKGIDQVIHFLKTNPDFALLVLGDGEERQNLEALAETLGVKTRCLFPGHRKNALRYFRYFDLYVMCSRSEGFGLCVIEAASQKIPVVCSDLPVYRELFDDEVVRFELEDIPSLSKAVHKAVTEKQVLSEKIFRRYKQCYTSDRMAANYLATYKKLLQEE
ncbi:MAG TPA: glycosyltransferase family 4 protein [Flavisolibacter sp.]|nr:glycosyltransferase family 4 protein [Flavisolibacter sp.]